MLPRGQIVARDMYGCRGFVAHHNTDIWGDCAPQDMWIPATLWPTGAAWLCLHLWEHFEYHLDKDFLARAWPLLREASLFFLDYLEADSTGRLITSPSSSPENTYRLPNGEVGSLCRGPSMDSQIIRALFDATLSAARILGQAAPGPENYITHIAEARDTLPPVETGTDGRIKEWAEEYEELEPGHRHISHLFALHPGQEIDRHTSPALAESARKTLAARLAQGGGHTGWSRLDRHFYARLGDARRPPEPPRPPRPLNAPQPLRQSPPLPDRRQLRGLCGHHGAPGAVKTDCASFAGGARQPCDTGQFGETDGPRTHTPGAPARPAGRLATRSGPGPLCPRRP